MAGSDFKAPPPLCMRVRVPAWLASESIFIIVSSEAWEEEEAFSPGQSGRHMPPWTMKRVETRESRRRARVCRAPRFLGPSERRVSILSDAQR